MIAGARSAGWRTHRKEEPSEGDHAQTAFVFQDAHLLPWRNVLENAALPLELMGVAGPERRDRAVEALRQVNLLEAVDKYPRPKLSGGMRMRVSLARALATERIACC